MTSAVFIVNLEHILPFCSLSGQVEFIADILTCRNYEKSGFPLRRVKNS